jgi:DNA-directed RNA polymerase subunit RPC12/RpoP
MTSYWYCKRCGKITDEFESKENEECPECRGENEDNI